MPTYKVTSPEGQVITFTGPAGMSKADIVQRAQQEAKFQGGEIPTTFSGGFSKHLVEDEPAARNALLGAGALALPVTGPTALAATAAVPFVGTGMKALSQMLRTGSPDIPASELGGDALEAGASIAAGPAMKAGARVVGAAKDAVASRVPAFLRGIPNLNPKQLAIDAATSRPVMGAIEAAGEAIDPRNIRQTFRNVLDGLTPGTQQVADDAPMVLDRFMPNKSRVSREVPGSSYPSAPPPADTPLPQSFQALTDDAVDRFMPNRSGIDPNDVSGFTGADRVPYGAPPVPEPAAAAASRTPKPKPSFDQRVDNVLESFGEPPASTPKYTGPERRAVVRKEADRITTPPAIPRERLDVPPATRSLDEVLSAFQTNSPHQAASYEEAVQAVNRSHAARNAAGELDVAASDPDAAMVPRMPLNRLKRILEGFNVPPEKQTPFDMDVLDAILQDPNGVTTFSKPYGPSGSR